MRPLWFQVVAVAPMRRPTWWEAGPGPGGSFQTSREREGAWEASGSDAAASPSPDSVSDLNIEAESHVHVGGELLRTRPASKCTSAMITLEIMTLQPKCEDVETAEGVAITVTGVAQVKVMVDNELLGYACEQFLGKSVMEIKSVILQTLEGHLRSILGTLTVEQIYQDRDRFAALVREVAAPDVGRMGIEILSFTIKDVYDKVEYLSSLGKSQTAAVQRDADIGVAEAERDAGIREAECKKEMMDIKFQADTKMADSKRGLEMQKAAFNQEVNTKKAEAQLAYELQAAKEQQKIRLEEIEIEVVQRKKQITIEEKEIDRTEKELIATVKRPAESEAYKMQQLAEGQK
ncbi:flotillin-2a-like isoform 5-T11 [Salvelinus alpinus]